MSTNFSSYEDYETWTTGRIDFRKNWVFKEWGRTRLRKLFVSTETVITS